MLQGGWFWGYLLAAVAFQTIFPIFSAMPHFGWRVMFWIAILPAVLTLWILAGVPESPIWLEHQHRSWNAQRETRHESKLSLLRIFQRDLLGTTILTTAVMSAFMCSGYSTAFWYPTLLRDAGRSTLPYLVAFNVGAIAGVVAFGRLSETILGRRGAVSIAALSGVASLPLYVHGTGPMQLCLGALTMGAFGAGLWGVAPAYVTEMFPTASRGIWSGTQLPCGRGSRFNHASPDGSDAGSWYCPGQYHDYYNRYHPDSLGRADLAGARNTRPQLQRTAMHQQGGARWKPTANPNRS